MRKLRLRKAKLLTQSHTANKRVDLLHHWGLLSNPAQPPSRANVKLRGNRGWASLHGIRQVIRITEGGGWRANLEKGLARELRRPSPMLTHRGDYRCQGSPNWILSPALTSPTYLSLQDTATPGLPLPLIEHTLALQSVLPGHSHYPEHSFHSSAWWIPICPKTDMVLFL